MSATSVGFSKFPNLGLLQQDASVSTTFEDSDTPKYTYDSMTKKLKNLGPIFLECLQQIHRLDNKIGKKSQQTMTPQLANEIDQLKLLRSDFQEALVQARRKSKKLIPLNNFVVDLWSAFKPDNYKPTALGTAPLVKWASGNSAKQGPYTRASQQIQIISMPGRYAEKGIIGWTAIAHEVGHDLLEGSGRLIDKVHAYLQKKLSGETAKEEILKSYFLNRVSEVAADIMGILLLGPAAGVGLIAFLRTYHNGLLSCADLNPGGAHPVDISRAYLVAYAINVLFPKTTAQEVESAAPVHDWNVYCDEIMREMLKDLAASGGDVLIPVDQQVLQVHCNEIATYIRGVVNALIHKLDKTVQIDKWKWKLEDEEIVRQLIEKGHSLGDSRHVVAAAFFDSLDKKIVESSTEEFFYSAQIHTDYQALQENEKQRIQNVFGGMLQSLAKGMT